MDGIGPVLFYGIFTVWWVYCALSAPTPPPKKCCCCGGGQ